MRKIILSLFIVLLSFSLYTTVFAENEDICVERTKTAINKMTEFTKELNTFTDSIIKSGKATEEQKKVYDKKTADFENYLRNDEYIVYSYYHPNYPTGEYDYYVNYSMRDTGVDIGKWDENILLSRYTKDYEKALRRYRINIILYKNGYRNLAAYLANYTKFPNGVYSLDDMKVTKVSDSYVELDLTHADYIISQGGEDTYGYGSIKIVSPSGNTYFFTGYNPLGDWNGYFVPTGRGLKLNCEYNGRKEFLLNTENKTKLVDYEAISLNDVFFNKYLKQSKVNWAYKGIKFNGDGKGNYYIKIPKGTSNDTDRTKNISDSYYENGSGDSGLWDVLSEDGGKYEYYWKTGGDILSYEIGVNLERTITYKDKVIHIDRY